MRIILHIGTEKTGTSSIQKFCLDNREQLLRQGVYYPLSPADRLGNHIKLSAYFQDSGWVRHLRRDLGITDPGQLKQFRRQFLFDLTKELSRHADKTVLFSNEHLSMCHDEDEIAKLAGLLKKFTRDIKILVYLRKQMDKQATLNATRIVRGEPGLKLNLTPAHLDSPNFDYLSMLDRWAKFFGKRNITVRPFERRQLVDGDAVKDFIDVLGLEGDFTFSRERNKRPSVECVQFLTYMAKHLPRMVDDAPHPYRRDLGDVVKKVAEGEPYSCPQLQKFEPHFDESNAEIARKYLARKDGILFKNAPRLDAEPPPLSVEQAVEIAAKLWIHQCKIIDRLGEEIDKYKALIRQLKRQEMLPSELAEKLLAEPGVLPGQRTM